MPETHSGSLLAINQAIIALLMRREQKANGRKCLRKARRLYVRRLPLK